jgi:hypothetical protein
MGGRLGSQQNPNFFTNNNVHCERRDIGGKKRGKIANKGACKELGTEKKLPTWETRSKVDPKNPKAEISNEDLSSKTNPWVEFEKNFRRAIFRLQKTTRSTLRKIVTTTKSQESVKSTVDNPELRNCRNT